MNRILHLNESDFRDLIFGTAHSMGVQPGIVEKDIWVCTVLQRLFSDMHLKNHLVFKGGTSLSKVYKLIQRFSEDVDLILDWRLFGYGNGELDPYIPRESKTKQDRFNKKIVSNASIYLRESFVPDVRELFSDITGVDVDDQFLKLD